VIERLVRAKQALDLHTSTFNQFVIYELVREGVLDHHIPRLRHAYQERRDAMLAALSQTFREAVWTEPEGGMFLMLKLLGEIDASHVLQHALKRNVAFVPGEEFYLDDQGKSTLRLNFSNADPDAIREGVKRLAAALSDVRSMADGRIVRGAFCAKP
jgi:2-aminoadipate transaminase